MKKTFLLVIMATIALLLTGCEAKDNSNIGAEITPPASEAVSQVPLAGSATPSQASQTDSLASSIDITSIDAVFNQNFGLAQDDAKKILGDAKFCFAQVNFLGGVISTKGEMNFFFENDSKIANYYWMVTLDSTQNNQKKRYLAAKRDWGSPACTTLTSPPSFALAFVDFINSGTVTSSTMLSTAKVVMTLTNNLWEIELFNTSGELILSQSQTASPKATTSPAS